MWLCFLSIISRSRYIPHRWLHDDFGLIIHFWHFYLIHWENQVEVRANHNLQISFHRPKSSLSAIHAGLSTFSDFHEPITCTYSITWIGTFRVIARYNPLHANFTHNVLSFVCNQNINQISGFVSIEIYTRPSVLCANLWYTTIVMIFPF